MERGHIVGEYIDGRIILKLILMLHGVRVKIRTSGRFL
jgi:hypothetical protein